MYWILSFLTYSQVSIFDYTRIWSFPTAAIIDRSIIFGDMYHYYFQMYNPYYLIYLGNVIKNENRFHTHIIVERNTVFQAEPVGHMETLDLKGKPAILGTFKSHLVCLSAWQKTPLITKQAYSSQLGGGKAGVRLFNTDNQSTVLKSNSYKQNYETK